MALSDIFPIPGVKHGERILVSVVENRASDDAGNPWVSVPVDDQDLSQGFKDITFRQLNNYANHAAQWLTENLPETFEPFQCVAYAGPKDLRYPILALAAAKLQKVLVLPSPLITPEAQKRILEAKSCALYLRPSSLETHVGVALKEAPHIQAITVPEIDEFMKETEAPIYTYPKSWEEGKDDPWLVFHTSGTTGYPKPLTYTHEMMGVADMVAATPDLEQCFAHHFAKERLYTPLPSLHLVGMILVLASTSFVHTTLVIGPPTMPTPETVMDILRYGQVKVALLTPAVIEELCLTPTGINALRNLKSVHYAGAPLSAKAGDMLISHTQVVPTIGSTESGGYLTSVHDKKEAWDYVSFQKHAGAVFEHRFDDLYELIFVRQPDSKLQSIFRLYPDLDRYPTSDLWIEHPEHKGLWKIVGRSDDHVSFSHGEGLYASRLEPEIEVHPAVKSALIGGHGHSAPVLLIELYPGAVEEDSLDQFLDSLQPNIEKVNAQVHDCVNLSTDRIIIATKEKPFIRTVKGSVGRMQTLNLYRDEVSALFE
ncbi:hypothetical protein PENFLA_c015G05828 [Penicillium flavigenum]|uniref:AMP-dependent synthetase/ligase domain-containing protein n=1 Tax=Penicillium flavigenum TaxID=254877 RepID=A0A1V6T3G3_9EURO|nr:hypothetical protein PENFLA_c015G05828 [Penicillium flavigenum]